MNKATANKPPTHVYAVRIVGGFYNPFFGTQKTAKTATKYWTEEEARNVIAKGLNALEVVKIRRSNT